ETAQELERCTFSRTAGPDESHSIPGTDGEIDIPQNRRIGTIVELDMPECNFSYQPGHRCFESRRVLHFWNNVEHLEDTLAGSERMLQHVVYRVDLIDWHVEQREVRDKHDQLTDREMLMQHLLGAVPQHECTPKTTHQHHAWRIVGPQIHGLQRITTTLVAFLIKSALFVGLPVKAHGFPDASQRIL